VAAQEVPMSERQYKASQAVDAQRKVLSEVIVARPCELQAELWKAYGTRGQEKSVRDARYHLTYLPDALATSEPTLFAHYVSWVKVLFASLESSDDFLVTTLECTRDAVQENLPADLGPGAPAIIAPGLEYLHQSPATLPTCLEPHGLLGGLARRAASCRQTRTANGGAGR
jgi:hypothetical protein